MQRPKYPLTPDTKSGAIELVRAWDNGLIDQYIRFRDSSDGNPKTEISPVSGVTGSLTLPTIGILMELSRYGLIHVEKQVERKKVKTFGGVAYPAGEPRPPTDELSHYFWEMVLLQELRNAVENDFEVSDYFLTVNAVGTIIQGDLIAHSGSGFLSSGINYGLMTQNIGTLADSLLMALGDDIDDELRDLIDEAKNLVNAPTDEQRSLASRIMSALNRRIGTMANAAGAIQLIANFLVAIERLT